MRKGEKKGKEREEGREYLRPHSNIILLVARCEKFLQVRPRVIYAQFEYTLRSFSSLPLLLSLFSPLFSFFPFTPSLCASFPFSVPVRLILSNLLAI